MNLVSLLFCFILVYLFYDVLKSKYRASKRDEIKYDEDRVQIPLHLCTTAGSDDEDLTFEEMEGYCEHHAKGKKAAYKIVKWKDIKSWEYKFINDSNDNHIIWLCITTANETISIQVIQLMKMKKYFKKHAREKQITNLTNKMEIWRIILCGGIIALIAYTLFFKN